MPPSAAASAAPRNAGLASASGGTLLAWSALVVLLYVALDTCSTVFALGQIRVEPWNPQVGLSLAVVFAVGPRIAPAVVVGAIAAECALRTAGGVAFDLAGGLVLGLGYVATGLAFRALGADRNIAR